MLNEELNTVSAGFYSALAAQRARIYHEQHKDLHSRSHLIKAEGMRGVLDFCYRNDGIFVTARAKSIAIKVDKAEVKNKSLLAEAESGWVLDGVTKKMTPQGVIYHIPV